MVKSLFTEYFTYYSVLTPVVSLVSVILLIITVWIIIKKSKKFSIQIIFLIGLAICFAFLAYQWIPYIKIKSAVQTGNIGEYRKAVKYALIPYQKGVFYAMMGNAYFYFNKDGEKALQCIETANKYTNDYASDDFRVAALIYNIKGDYNKAVSIAKTHDNINTLVISYILKNDYKQALIYANRCIEANGINPWNYCHRAIIYKNLAEYEAAEKDYRQAIKLCGANSNLKESVSKMYIQYKTAIKDRYSDLAGEYKFVN